MEDYLTESEVVPQKRIEQKEGSRQGQGFKACRHLGSRVLRGVASVCFGVWRSVRF